MGGSVSTPLALLPDGAIDCGGLYVGQEHVRALRARSHQDHPVDANTVVASSPFLSLSQSSAVATAVSTVLSACTSLQVLQIRGPKEDGVVDGPPGWPDSAFAELVGRLLASFHDDLAILQLRGIRLVRFPLTPSLSDSLGRGTAAFPNLVRLDLRHNRLTSLPASLATSLPGLSYLNLSHNQLTWQGLAFKAVTEDGDAADDRQGGDSSSFPVLTALLLQHNMLAGTLGPKHLRPFPAVTLLDISHNAIERFSEKLCKCATWRGLETLVAEWNQLELGEREACSLFSATARLHTLFLAHNVLTAFSLPRHGERDREREKAGGKASGRPTKRRGGGGRSSNALPPPPLHSLDLSHNQLTILDPSLGTYPALSLLLEGNPLVLPPLYIVEQGTEVVQSYLRTIGERERHGAEEDEAGGADGSIIGRNATLHSAFRPVGAKSG